MIGSEWQIAANIFSIYVLVVQLLLPDIPASLQLNAKHYSTIACKLKHTQSTLTTIQNKNWSYFKL